MTPTVLMSTPSTCAVTAYLRIAPTAIRNREVPIVTQQVVDRVRPGATRLAARPRDRLALIAATYLGSAAISEVVAIETRAPAGGYGPTARGVDPRTVRRGAAGRRRRSRRPTHS